MENRHKWVVITYILSQLVPGFVVGFIIALTDILHENNVISFELSVDFGVALAASIGSLISLLVTVLLMRQEIKKTLHPISNIFNKVVIGWGVGGAFLMVFVQYITTSIERLVGIGSGSENTNTITSMVQNYPLLVLFPTIYAPFLEEIVFRKFLFGGMKKKLGPIAAAILSSLIFGAIHLDFPHLLTYVGMGVTLAFLYHHTKKIYVSMIAHCLFNTFVVLTQLALLKIQS